MRSRRLMIALVSRGSSGTEDLMAGSLVLVPPVAWKKACAEFSDWVGGVWRIVPFRASVIVGIDKVSSSSASESLSLAGVSRTWWRSGATMCTRSSRGRM